MGNYYLCFERHSRTDTNAGTYCNRNADASTSDSDSDSNARTDCNSDPDSDWNGLIIVARQAGIRQYQSGW
jgi:hypothetical protein